jgi:thiamine biosynthesis protein ThiI
LITYDKEETIAIAKRIGTYETSNLPFDDCCTLFNPKIPETNANMIEIQEFWTKIIDEGILDMAKEAIDKAEVVEFK